MALNILDHQHDFKIGGVGEMVEVDESKFGKGNTTAEKDSSESGYSEEFNEVTDICSFLFNTYFASVVPTALL